MSFYSELADTVVEMLTEFGAPVTLHLLSQSGGDYDPNTQVASPIGASGTYDETRYALVCDQPGSQISIHFGQTLQNGTMIQASDKWIYMDANGSAPRLGFGVTFDSIRYTIVDVQVTGPGLVPLYYLLVLRT